MLAADSIKDRLVLGRYHRLAYNGFAVLHLGIVWWLGRAWLSAAPPLGVPPTAALIGDGATILGLIVIAVALTGYDRGRFLGTTQIRSPAEEPDEGLKTGGLLRYVRHPLYSGLFLVLWGHAQTEFALATAAWGSIYLLIGAMYEERRLADRYGAAYVEYRRRVPAFIPWRGRAD
ncbi:MAG: protein-S-isoprenylcysteine O-methyltransferase Ste14 [Paracoccaceae bacterium]